MQLQNKRRNFFRWVPVLSATAAVGLLLSGVSRSVALPGQAAPEDPDAVRYFEEQVRPILMNRCVRCHGGEKVEAELSFANRELTLAGGDSGALIDWDKPEESLLLRAISYTDIDYEMPPTGKMPAAEIEVLKSWVKMGMPWTPGEAGNLADPDGADAGHHGPMTIEEGRQAWQYNPVVRPDIPKVDDPAWAENPVDAFIYDKLDEAGLKPNPEADRRTLIRRATYDLTGLPPTPEEIEAFVNDTRPDAWERLVDRLLASPHYGEKWARHWMDVVRYAETDGYERDGKKLNMWRYRDYLIRAFNEDKPYDRFVMEHIAGDELPDRTPASILATGYNRLQVWDDEPTDRVQARADYIADVVDTTGSAFLGMSVGCARCHDHKKDPILQDDYYSLFAFFNNITEPQRGNDRAIAVDIPDPPTPQIAETERKREARIKELTEQTTAIEAKFLTDWSADEQTEPRVVIRDARTRGAEPWRVSFEKQDGWQLQAFDDSAWPQQRGGFGDPLPAARAHSEWKTNEIYLRRTFHIADEVPRYLYLTLFHDENVQVFINGILVYEQTGHLTDYQTIPLPPEAADALVVGSNSIAVSCTHTRGARYIDVGLGFGIVDRNAIVDAALERNGVEILGQPTVDRYLEMRGELQSLKARPLIQPYPASVIAERGRKAPQQHIHMRGSALADGDPVQPGFPEVLGGGDATPATLTDGINSSGQRLTLARWIARPENPMTARVMANRIWQHHFGKGIVESTSEFGVLGTGATHPQLLDYLADEFVKRDWSIKEMHRLMMNSKAYRMSSAAQQEGLNKDPINTLLWRYNMRRLTAEEFRDSVLAVNGSLNPQLFGPSVYTKMPAEVLATASRPEEAWGNSPEDQRNRRSIYIAVKRSLREPLLASLDQAETDSPCPVRFTTTVPTQSLITLNGDFVQDEATVFAKHLRELAGPRIEDQVKLGLRLVFGRTAEPEQVAENLAFINEIKQEHGLSDERAMQIFGVVCFNLNEFMYID